MIRRCEYCGEVMTIRKPSDKRRFCNHRCAFAVIGDVVRAAAETPAAKARRGDGRRGTGKGDGYVKRGGRHEHRAVAEEMLGRPLEPGEVVRHLDRVKANNGPENLKIYTTRSAMARDIMLDVRGKQRSHGNESD